MTGTADPSATLRFGRDDNSVGKRELQIPNKFVIPTEAQRSGGTCCLFSVAANAKRPGLLGPGLLFTLTCLLVAEEQNAGRLVFSHFAYRAVEELVVFEVNLKERRTLCDSTSDQGFGQWILDVALQRTAQGSCPVGAVD